MERYGWTPQQLEDAPAEVVGRIFQVLEAEYEIAMERAAVERLSGGD